MKTTKKNLIALAALAGLALVAGSAMAESQYGYNASGAGVNATARVTLTVSVPKMILLRVGDAAAGPATRNWTAALTIPGTPITPSLNGNAVAANWDGTAVTSAVTGPTAPAGLAVYAWTNAVGGGSITYNVAEITGTGPKLANFTVTGTGVPHPGGATALVASAFPTAPFAALTLLSGTWTYALDATGAAGWQAGTYSTIVTYTASAV